jgi:putative RNA 2'-phosphotransferase
MTSDLIATSRFLSYVLRHNPSAIGATLDDSGWISIDGLLAAATGHGRDINRETLDRIVNATGKRRFEIRGEQIRAAQGHSIPVDLGLDPRQPPALLYHGTVQRFLQRILAEGLKPGERTHVHLSADPATAAAVGARRGRPVILAIQAAALHRSGQQFYRAANGVWLTSHVSPEWIRLHIQD